MNKPPFHLIETFSGKTIARGKTMESLKDAISEQLAGHYTIHHETEGWFAPATTLFNHSNEHASR